MGLKTSLSLVRHGLVHNPDDLYYGRLPGFGLADVGRAQAALAGQYLARWPIAALYHSPMQRALETAEIIAAQLPAPPPLIETELLHEVHTRFDGWPAAAMEARGWDFYSDEPPPYEQPNAILARVLAFFEVARAAHPGQHTAGVTHGDVVSFALQWAAGLPIEPRRDLRVCRVPQGYPAQACVATFEFDGGRLVDYAYVWPAGMDGG